MDRFTQVRHQIQTAQHRHERVPEMVRGARVPYYRRGVMSIPAFQMDAGGEPAADGRASSLRLMRKASALPVDFFFYDLEDAAPDDPDFKPWARQFVVDAFNELDFGPRIRAFRPNNIRTPYFEDDIVKVVGEVGDRLDAIVLPKTETADEVRDVQNILRTMQRIAGYRHHLCLEVLIESPRAFLEAEKIAAMEDVSALVFGPFDFARTVGGSVEPDTWLSDQATVRQMLPVIAAAYGKDAVDGITATLPLRPRDDDDAEGKARHAAAVARAAHDAAEARRLGYAAKWILHPDQIEPIQSAWTPTRDRALAALNLAADYTRAAAAGSGAGVRAGGHLTDKAVVGADWWLVRAALHAGVLTEADVSATGFTLQVLERTVRTRDK